MAEVEVEVAKLGDGRCDSERMGLGGREVVRLRDPEGVG